MVVCGDNRALQERLSGLPGVSLGWVATFFVVGEHLEPHAGLVTCIREAGHELAVHGWSHRMVTTRTPTQLTADLHRIFELLAGLTGIRPQWFRPPFGLTTRASLHAARQAQPQPVLWTAWGHDWSRHVTVDGMVWRVQRTLRPGGTVLLRDTDRYGAAGSWRRAAQALYELLGRWSHASIPVGPLCEHELSATRGSAHGA